MSFGQLLFRFALLSAKCRMTFQTQQRPTHTGLRRVSEISFSDLIKPYQNRFGRDSFGCFWSNVAHTLAATHTHQSAIMHAFFIRILSLWSTGHRCHPLVGPHRMRLYLHAATIVNIA